jgi:hypothetical protein
VELFFKWIKQRKRPVSPVVQAALR